MKFTSVLFLALLFVSSAFATELDPIEMLQNTEAGNEILEHIFIQTGLEGAKLSHASVSATLTNIANNVRTFRKSLAQTKLNTKKECGQNLGMLKARYNDFVLRAAHATRTLGEYRALEKHNDQLTTRARQDLHNNENFNSMNTGNAQAWGNFWKSQTGSVRFVSDLLNRISTHIKNLHRGNKKNAFVELPTDYVNIFSQISTELNNTDDTFNGFRPAIVNLVQIAKDVKHLRKSTTRKALRRLVNRLAEVFQDVNNAYREENEHQSALFGGVSTLYADRISTIKEIQSKLATAKKLNDQRLKWLATATSSANGFVRSAHNLVTLKSTECKNIYHYIERAVARGKRVLSGVAQVKEVLHERFPEIKRQVIQKRAAPKNNKKGGK
jgi:hypothetical protein